MLAGFTDDFSSQRSPFIKGANLSILSPTDPDFEASGEVTLSDSL